MVKVDRFPPDDPREWLNRARSNLLRASAAPPAGVYLEDLCADAQQAAEKAIKAVFIARGIRYPYIHDLGELLRLLASRGEAVPAAVREAGRLTEHVPDRRYPGRNPVTEAEHERAVADARAVVAWAADRVAQVGWVRERSSDAYPSGSDEPWDRAEDPRQLRDVVDRIVAAADPERIILFGSAARGETGEDSDLDLLIVKEAPWRKSELWEAIYRSLEGVGVATDLVLATPGDLERYGAAIGLVYLPALEEGRVVYERGHET